MVAAPRYALLAAGLLIALFASVFPSGRQSDKISHIDTQDVSIDSVISHFDNPYYPISITRMNITIWWMTQAMSHIPYR
jgi:hypothetical protein